MNYLKKEKVDLTDERDASVIIWYFEERENERDLFQKNNFFCLFAGCNDDPLKRNKTTIGIQFLTEINLGHAYLSKEQRHAQDERLQSAIVRVIQNGVLSCPQDCL